MRHGFRYAWRKGCRCDLCHEAVKAHAQHMNAKRRGFREAQPTAGRPPRVDGQCRCGCGQLCGSRMALGRHTWAKHDRWPTDDERTILTAEWAAA